MNLPDGFDDATEEMQARALHGCDERELINAIYEEVVPEPEGTPYDTTAMLAELFVEVRKEHRLAGAEPRQQPTNGDDND